MLILYSVGFTRDKTVLKRIQSDTRIFRAFDRGKSCIRYLFEFD